MRLIGEEFGEERLEMLARSYGVRSRAVVWCGVERNGVIGGMRGVMVSVWVVRVENCWMMASFRMVGLAEQIVFLFLCVLGPVATWGLWSTLTYSGITTVHQLTASLPVEPIDSDG